MRFQKLRLSGFKSFVDPTEFRIEPGLTAIVGPNGCGKSNLLEALRWVMGANSAKAMRAEGMDDVIFGGTGARPARNHAEVVLTIDNAERRAPAQFNDHAILEVSRRIDRGAGSTYRVNGVEARARDVQLLFADASTGANSPALVRQGQISELIAAKPSNRRRVLEEAAGVSGLHSRRHESDLRLKAAEANLERLDDVARELGLSLNRLRREARQAETYKQVAAEIRTLQGAAVYVKWQDAKAALDAAEAEHAAANLAVEAAAREAAEATTAALAAAEALKPLRDEAAVAAHLLQRLAIEQDRIEREGAEAQALVMRLEADMKRQSDDQAREAELAKDAAAALARLAEARAALEAEIAAAPERLPELEAALDAAAAVRAEADAEVERLAAELAARAAQARAAAERLAQSEAAARAARARAEEAKGRLARTEGAHAAAERDRASLNLETSPEAKAAEEKRAAAEMALNDARAALEAAEAKRAELQIAETAARDAARQTDDTLRRLKAEAQGLASLTRAPAGRSHPTALEAVSPERGYEAALAAAMGEDLDAALDSAAPSYWAGAATPAAIAWPEGATPLAPLVKAPPELAASLALTALVARADGPKLQKSLPVGARLVSKEGDLWRWDGFTVRAEAEQPAAKRLAQRARLAEVEDQLAELAPKAQTAQAAHEAAARDLRSAEAAVQASREPPRAAERALAQAREAVEAHARDAARREARAQALDQTIQGFAAEAQAARSSLDAAEAEATGAEAALASLKGDAPLDLTPDPSGALHAARVQAGVARENEAGARAAQEAEVRERGARLARRDQIEREAADWSRRAAEAAAREQQQGAEREKTAAALVEAKETPLAIAERRRLLMDDLGTAEARRSKAQDALAQGEAAQHAADRLQRAAETRGGEAREARAASTARREAAAERLASVTEQLIQTAKLEPEALGRKLAEEGASLPTGLEALETRLARLEGQREALGAVNLRAQEEAKEHAERLAGMETERADLIGAVRKLRAAIEELNAEGRERLLAAFETINTGFKALFATLFEGGQAELKLVESDDPLEAGLEIFACPPGKRLAAMSLMSGGEQALTATALIFGVFLANPAPICVLDEVDAPLDDANVDRFCRMLDEMRRRTETRFIAITHNPVTMSRMDRLFGVTMAERGVSQLVSVDLSTAEAMAAQ